MVEGQKGEMQIEVVFDQNLHLCFLSVFCCRRIM